MVCVLPFLGHLRAQEMRPDFRKLIAIPACPAAKEFARTNGVAVEGIDPTPTSTWKLPPGTPCYTYPLSLQVNNQPVLMTTLVVAPPDPPLLGCAGIVGLLAENPKDTQEYLLLRIISAHHRSTHAKGSGSIRS